MTGLYNRLFKRGIDFLGAICALVLLSPLMLLVSMAIRIDSPGPALFRQRRTGRYGEPFTIFKFRSMPLSTPNLPSAAAGQLVVTRVGRVIRRTNIDELPQLLNILRGDMSFIGPRPALPSQSELLEKRRVLGVLAARPGLTGLAQVNAYQGMPESEKVDWERRYVQHVTLLGDVGIIFRTFVYILKPPPAY